MVDDITETLEQTGVESFTEGKQMIKEFRQMVQEKGEDQVLEKMREALNQLGNTDHEPLNLDSIISAGMEDAILSYDLIYLFPRLLANAGVSNEKISTYLDEAEQHVSFSDEREMIEEARKKIGISK